MWARTVSRIMTGAGHPTSAAPDPLPLHVAIGHSVQVRAQSLITLEDRRAAALIAIIAIDGSAWAHRAAAMLWPDAHPMRAQLGLDALHTELAAVCGRPLLAGVELLAFAHDVSTQICMPARDLDGPDDQSTAALILGAYRYDDLAELGAWVRAAQSRALRVARMRSTDLSYEAERTGDLAAAIAHAQQALALDRHCEDCVQRLMQLLARAGQPAVALTLYARSDALMRRHYGTPLSADLRTLADDIARAPAASPLSTLPRVSQIQ